MKLLARQPDITAFFAHNDLLAIGALSALRKLGKEVPGDCSVVGCDDIEMAAYTVPPLTTVLVPFHEAGVSAMSVLLGLIGGGTAPAGNVFLPLELVVRESTAPPKFLSPPSR